MQNFQDTSETSKQSFISDFSICMTVPLMLLAIPLKIITSNLCNFIFPRLIGRYHTVFHTTICYLEFVIDVKLYYL